MPSSLRVLWVAALLGLSACGGGGGGGYPLGLFAQPGSGSPAAPATGDAPDSPDAPDAPDTPAATRTLNVQLSGFIGDQVVLQNGSDEITLAEDGSYSFSTPVAVGASYAVSVKSQPGTLTRTCAVDDGSDTMPASGTVSVSVVCSAPPVRYAYATLLGTNQIAGWSVDASDGHPTSPVSTVSSGAYPIALTADPTGRFLYTLNFLGGTIDVWQIGPGGILVPVTTTPLGTNGHSRLAIEPRGKFLYVAGRSTNEVLKFVIDPVLGTLSNGASVPTGSAPDGMTIDASGRHLYVASRNSNWIEAFAIDRASGDLSAVPGVPTPIGLGPTALSMDPKGRFVYSYDSDDLKVSVLRRDPVTGALSAAGPAQPAGANGSALAVEPGGRMVHAIGSAPSQVSSFAVDAAAGTLAGAGTIAGGVPGFNGVAMDPNGLFMLVSSEVDNAAYGYSVNPATGAAATSPWSSLPIGPGPSAIALTR